MRFTKEIICLLFLTSLLASCQSDVGMVKVEDGNYYYTLKGPVNNLEINTYDPLETNHGIIKGKLNNGSTASGTHKLGARAISYSFDVNGNLVTRILYKRGTKDIWAYYEYKYQDNKLISAIDYGSTQKESKISIGEYEYDKFKRLSVRR